MNWQTLETGDLETTIPSFQGVSANRLIVTFGEDYLESVLTRYIEWYRFPAHWRAVRKWLEPVT